MKRKLIILFIESYLLRKGLVSLLNRMPGIFVLKEMSHTASAADEINSLNPDFCIISSGLLGGIEDFLLSRPEWYGRIVLLSENGKKESRLIPVAGIINTDDAKDVLIKKMTDIFCPGNTDPENGPQELLSKREKTILVYLCKGLTNKQIADKLYLSAHTVNTHRKNISNKLGIRSLSGLTVFAILNDLISIEEVASVNEPDTNPDEA